MNLKKLTALSLAAVLALNLAGRNVYADESIIDESVSEESVNDESNGNETLFESDEEQQKSNDENHPLETDGEIGTNDVEDTQDSIENEGIVDEGVVDKQIITGFADLDESVFTVEEKLPIKELGLPEQLPVYINGSDEVEYIAVTWECADYENTEYESYTFSPAWYEDSYELALDIDSNAVPVIEVNIQNVMSIDSRESNVVTPEVGDYEFTKDGDNIKITGINEKFLSGLTAEQKQNINLVIPESINGQKVKSIGDYAFDTMYYSNTKYKGCTITGLDLTNATFLETIGNNAFYNLNTGTELRLPKSITKIGNKAFSISSSTHGFIGELVIPENVETIGTLAFSNQAGFNSVRFESKKLTELPDELFKNCTGLNGVLKIPEYIKKIGSKVFYGTKYNAIYLPKRTDNNTDFISKTAFGENTTATLIICDENDYNYIFNQIYSNLQSNVGYEMTVSFETNGEGSFEPITRLFNHPYNLVKQSDGQWVKTNYKFPKTQGKKWGLNATDITPVTESSLITQDKLYPIIEYEDPVITFSEHIDKVYDGQPATLTVTVSHPLANSASQAENGDVLFYYWWSWDTITPKKYVLKGFDKNQYAFSDVLAPYGISCTVTVGAYVVYDDTKTKLFYSTSHHFHVNMHQADPIVNPIYPRGMVNINSDFPEIKLSEGDTAGTITWDKGQTLKEGINDYTWTFTPKKNAVNAYNYKTASGTVQLNGVKGYTVTAEEFIHGSFSIDKPQGAIPGESITINFIPDIGYKVASAKLDDSDITNYIVNNKYTIENMQHDSRLSVSFESMETKDVEDVIESLPDIKDVVITEEVKNDILDAKLHYDAITKDSEDISEDAKEKMYEAISKLDQVETAITTKANVNNNIDVSNEVPLLENMETADAEALKNSNTTSLKIELVVDNAKIEGDKQQILDSVLGDAVVGDSFDVTVIKKLTDNNVTKETPLKELKKPIQLIFEIPSNLPVIEQGYVREFSIIRLHEVGGQIIPEVLKDEDSFEDSISVSSDKFSTYIIVYKDVKKQDSSQGGGSGSYIKTYTIRFETFGGSSIDSITDVKTGKKINAPTEPKRKGYIFKGWYIDQACTELWDFSKNAVTSNLTLYAGWEKIAEAQTFNLVFDSMGGSIVDEMKGVAAGEIVNVSVIPVKEGYTFKGWYIDKACTIPWDYIVNDNLILYAGWNKNEIERQSFLIVFESNNGDSTLSEYLPTGDKVSMPESPVREGYTFIGWFVDEECTIPFELDTAVNSNVTLYAGWKEIERQIHLVISEETAEKKSENIKVTEGKKAEMPKEPVKEGYIFKGWFADKECTIPWDFDINVVDKDMTLYAGWEKVEEKKETNEQPEKEPTVSKEANNTTVVTLSALAAVTALIACVFVFKRKKANK